MGKRVEKDIEIVKVFKVLGFTEDIDQCGCCGRADLKGTVAMEIVESGAIVYYGVVCAAKAQGFTKKYVEDKVKEAIVEAKRKANAEIKEHPISAEHDAFMAETDKQLEDMSRRNVPYEEWSAVVRQRIAMGDKLRALKEEVKKKYLLKYL